MVSAGKVSGQAVIVARFMGMAGDSRISVPADRLLPENQYANLPVKNFIDELAYAPFKQLGLFPSQPSSASPKARSRRRKSSPTLTSPATPARRPAMS